MSVRLRLRDLVFLLQRSRALVDVVRGLLHFHVLPLGGGLEVIERYVGRLVPLVVTTTPAVETHCALLVCFFPNSITGLCAQVLRKSRGVWEKSGSCLLTLTFLGVPPPVWCWASS